MIENMFMKHPMINKITLMMRSIRTLLVVMEKSPAVTICGILRKVMTQLKAVAQAAKINTEPIVLIVREKATNKSFLVPARSTTNVKMKQ